MPHAFRFQSRPTRPLAAGSTISFSFTFHIHMLGHHYHTFAVAAGSEDLFNRCLFYFYAGQISFDNLTSCLQNWPIKCPLERPRQPSSHLQFSGVKSEDLPTSETGNAGIR